jgi:hypothetical protein
VGIRKGWEFEKGGNSKRVGIRKGREFEKGGNSKRGRREFEKRERIRKGGEFEIKKRRIQNGEFEKEENCTSFKLVRILLI